MLKRYKIRNATVGDIICVLEQKSNQIQIRNIVNFIISIYNA